VELLNTAILLYYIDMEEKYVKKIASLAKKAFTKKEIPIGAIVIDKDGKIIGEGYNLTHKNKDSTKHAEIIALQKAFKKKKDWRLDGCTLMVNLEPCLMCLGAIANARLKKVVYFIDDPQFGSVASKLTKAQLKKLFPKLTIEKVADNLDTLALLQEFFKNLRSK